MAMTPKFLWMPLFFLAACASHNSLQTPRVNLEARCISGDATACVRQAQAGEVAEVPVLQLRQLWSKACQAGSGLGCNGSARRAYSLGDSAQAQKDYARAIELGYEGGASELLILKKEDEGLLKKVEDNCRAGLAAECMSAGYVALARKEYRSAASIFAQACRSRTPHGCLELGIIQHRQGRVREAIINFEKSCQEGSSRSCLLETFAKKLKDPSFSVKFSSSCREGNAESCLNQGIFEILHGNPERMTQPLQKACDLKQGWACYFSGIENPLMVRDESSTRKLQLACDYGVGAGCSLLSGILKGSDPARASSSLQRACDLGMGTACVELAEANPEAASRLLEQGCRAGFQKACFKLAVQKVESGGAADRSVVKDLCQKNLAEACEWQAYLLIHEPSQKKAALQNWEKACRLGSSHSCYVAASVNDQKSERARQTQQYLHACRLGSEGACRAAAKNYRDEKKIRDARMLLEQQCRFGISLGCAELADLDQEEGKLVQEKAHRRQACELGHLETCTTLGYQ